MNHYHVERSLHLHVHNSSDHDVANKRLTCSLGHVPGTVVDALRVLTARVLETALCRGRGLSQPTCLAGVGTLIPVCQLRGQTAPCPWSLRVQSVSLATVASCFPGSSSLALAEMKKVSSLRAGGGYWGRFGAGMHFSCSDSVPIVSSLFPLVGEG